MNGVTPDPVSGPAPSPEHGGRHGGTAASFAGLPTDKSNSIVESRLWTVAVALAGAIVSVLLQGFHFGGSNNIFHLPILFDLYNEQAFADDVYIQSLRYFSSSYWSIVKPFITEDNAKPAFLALHLFTRTMCFWGFLLCASLLKIHRLGDQLLFAGIVAIIPAMRGASAAGAGGLFNADLTHSELANALTLFMLYWLISGRVALALAVNGAIFSINAFMGVWNALPAAILLGDALRKSPQDWRRLAVQTAIGTALFCGLAAPTIVWIGFASLGAPPYAPFDYIAYLREFGAPHFLLDTIRDINKLYLLVVVTLAFLSFGFAGEPGRKFRLAIAGFGLVYLIGMAAPHLTGERLVLNLHLLRVSYAFHLLATLGLAALIVRWVTSDSPEEAVLFGPALALTCTIDHWLSPLAVVVMAAAVTAQRYGVPRFAQTRLMGWRPLAIVVMSAIVIVTQGMKARRDLAATGLANDVVAEWQAIGTWARSASGESSQFLLPAADVADVSPAFEAFAHRRAWICHRRGAAVMWSPWYYETWSRRMREVRALGPLSGQLAYARSNGIDYVVAERETLDPAAPTPVFATNRLAVFRVTP